MSDESEQFLDKLEAFANSLDGLEKAILMHLLGVDDEVSGFMYRGDSSADSVVSGPIPIPRAGLTAQIDGFISPAAGGFTAPGDVSGIISGGAAQYEI